MSEREFYTILLFVFLGIGVFVFVALFFVSAPYGRHARFGTGKHFRNIQPIERPLFLSFFEHLGVKP